MLGMRLYYLDISVQQALHSFIYLGDLQCTHHFFYVGRTFDKESRLCDVPVKEKILASYFWSECDIFYEQPEERGVTIMTEALRTSPHEK